MLGRKERPKLNEMRLIGDGGSLSTYGFDEWQSINHVFRPWCRARRFLAYEIHVEGVQQFLSSCGSSRSGRILEEGPTDCELGSIWRRAFTRPIHCNIHRMCCPHVMAYDRCQFFPGFGPLVCCRFLKQRFRHLKIIQAGKNDLVMFMRWLFLLIVKISWRNKLNNPKLHHETHPHTAPRLLEARMEATTTERELQQRQQRPKQRPGPSLGSSCRSPIAVD